MMVPAWNISVYMALRISPGRLSKEGPACAGFARLYGTEMILGAAALASSFSMTE